MDTQIPITEEYIKQQADKLLLNSGLVGQFPLPVDKVAEHLGYSCSGFTPSEKTKEVSGAISHKEKKILFNAKEPLARIIFTIAHEIGHAVLHPQDCEFVDFRRPSANQKEREADSFAANLLMPESVFRAQWNRNNGSFVHLSAFFGVSKPAIGVRAMMLGLG